MYGARGAGHRGGNFDLVADQHPIVVHRNPDVHRLGRRVRQPQHQQHHPRRHQDGGLRRPAQHRHEGAGDGEQCCNQQPIGGPAAHCGSSPAPGGSGGSVGGVGTESRHSSTTDAVLAPRTHISGSNTIRCASAGTAIAFTSSGVT